MATTEPVANLKAPAGVTPAEMIARAREIAPRLRERAAAAEAARCVPPETMADYHRTGLLRMCQPKRYGGYEMGWDVMCRTGQILAAACGSQGWLQRIMADHAQMVATFPAEAQEDVWHDDHKTVICAAFDPVGRARRVRGGFRFSGRHGFSSGIDYAEWLICGGSIEDGDRLDGPHFFLVPRADAVLIDDWDTVGLEGTGSKSFEIKDAFIPEHRFLDGAKARIGEGPGTRINMAPVYRVPRGGVTSTGFAALTVGMAQGVLDEWLRYTAPRKSRGVPVADEPGMQMVAARSAAEIDAADGLYFGTIDNTMRVLETGGRLGEFDLTTARRNVSFACQLSLKAGTRLFNVAGGRALFRGHALERQYRNLIASAAHHAVSWDRNALSYGKELIGRYRG